MILMITPLYPPHMGGASVYFSYLVDFLKEYTGIVVLTVSSRNQRIAETSGKAKIFRLIPNLSSSSRMLRWPVSVLSSFVFTLCLYFKYKPRIIHMHSTGAIAFGASLASFVLRIPVVKDTRDILFRKFNIRLGIVKKYLVCGKAIKKRLTSYGIDAEKIRVIPVINHPLVHKVKQRKSKESSGRGTIFHIAFVGNLDKEKGADNLLEALGCLGDLSKKICLTFICGTINKWGSELIKKTRGNPRKFDISVQENLHYEKTLNLISKADALILPSYSEGYPRVILEAFELGTPVIATQVGGIPELIRNHVNGILVSPGNPKELSHAIRYLVENQTARKEISENAKDYLSKLHYSWQELAKELTTIYQS